MKKRPDAIALRVKRKRDEADKKEHYVKWTWEKYYKDCIKFA